MGGQTAVASDYELSALLAKRTSFGQKGRMTAQEPLGLAQLQAQIQRDLDLLQYPPREWVKPKKAQDGRSILDVLIIGGGQGGLATAFGLMRERVSNILVVDQNAKDQAGPWTTFARMHTLRTPKHVTGPEQGIGALTVRAWYEAQHGIGSWETMGLIPKESWNNYLNWYRDTLSLPVRHQTQAGTLKWLEADKCFEVPLKSPEREETILARRIVLATGIEGSGQWQVPGFIKNNLPEHCYSHTRHEIDFAQLKGKRVGVLGAGASAFDNASVALETGAADVRLYFRRKSLPRVNPYRWAEFVGFLHHHADLSIEDRWKFIVQILKMGQLPPTDTYHRATQHQSFSLHADSAWKSVKYTGEEIEVETTQGTEKLDFVICGTGFVTDLSLRPELAHMHQEIALWKDKYTPPAELRLEDLLRHPFLNEDFSFQGKEEASPEYLRYIHNYTFGCLPSMGFGGASISGMKYSIRRLISGLTRSLYAEDKDSYFEDLCNFDLEEF